MKDRFLFFRFLLLFESLRDFWRKNIFYVSLHFPYRVLTWYDKRDKNDMVEKLFHVFIYFSIYSDDLFVLFEFVLDLFLFPLVIYIFQSFFLQDYRNK